MLRNTAIAVGSILFLAGALLVGLEDLFKRSEAYQLGVSRFGESAAAAAELGAPLRVGWLVKGSINVRNERGVAQLAIPVSGAARSARSSRWPRRGTAPGRSSR